MYVTPTLITKALRLVTCVEPTNNFYGANIALLLWFCFVTKATPMHRKLRYVFKHNKLVQLVVLVQYHVNVINSLRADTHTHTHAHTDIPTLWTKAFSKKSGSRLPRAWFKKYGNKKAFRLA